MNSSSDNPRENHSSNHENSEKSNKYRGEGELQDLDETKKSLDTLDLLLDVSFILFI